MSSLKSTASFSETETNKNSTPPRKKIKSSFTKNDSAKLEDVRSVYEKVGVDGYHVSKEFKSKVKESGDFMRLENTTYGEIDLEDFALLLMWIRENLNLNPFQFLDVGAGTAKPIFIAPLVFNTLQHSIGLEIVSAYLEKKDLIVSEMSSLFNTCKFTLQCQDSFTEESKQFWRDSDLIYIPTTCFTEDLMKKTENFIENTVKEGAVVITTTRKPTCKCLKLVHEKRYKYAKGSLRFVVFVKTTSGK